MGDIFVSYTSTDREWAEWIGHELERLNHTPHLHDWEIKAGDDIMAWMVERHDQADFVLGVVSDEWLRAAYSKLERMAAEWAAAKRQTNFMRYVVVRPAKLPTIGDHRNRAELFGVPDEVKRQRLKDFLEKPQRPPPPSQSPDPGVAVSNITIRVPTHFLGRDNSLSQIDAALKRYEGRVAITALHGLRGVGKTTLAAAYAEKHRGDYRATWWIRAQTPDTTRADLVSLGVRLKWVAADEKEEPALRTVMERLRHEGEGLLLIFDNAIDAKSLEDFLPPGGASRVLITSNAHDWGALAEPIDIRLWPKNIGADFLILRTRREAERAEAERLSEALGGLPLAHEQAAAYCERLGVGFGEYLQRFEKTPIKFLADARHAPRAHNDGQTVERAFALAIEEAAKLHPMAEPLIVHAALLAPEPIPLFLLEELWARMLLPPAGEGVTRSVTDEGSGDLAGSPAAPLTRPGSAGPPSPTSGRGDAPDAREELEEAIAALCAFALVDRETVVDEREPTEKTDTIRLHRLVREVAKRRRDGEALETARRTLLEGMAAVYPRDVFDDPKTWPRARRLDALALALVGGDAEPPKGAEEAARSLLFRLAGYRRRALASYVQARAHYERALEICEKELGPEHAETALRLSGLLQLLKERGDYLAALPLAERALAINEKALGAEHPETAISLDTLASLLRAQGDLSAARPLCERALAIFEKTLGAEHPHTATALNSFALLLEAQGDLAAAQARHERALTIYENVLGPEHLHTNCARDNLARLLLKTDDAGWALALAETALVAFEKILGPDHPWTKNSTRVTAEALEALGRAGEAAVLRGRFGL